MFWFMQKPSSGSKCQYLAKITKYGSTVLVHTKVVSIMAAYWSLLCVRVVHRAGRDSYTTPFKAILLCITW